MPQTSKKVTLIGDKHQQYVLACIESRLQQNDRQPSYQLIAPLTRASGKTKEVNENITRSNHNLDDDELIERQRLGLPTSFQSRRGRGSRTQRDKDVKEESDELVERKICERNIPMPNGKQRTYYDGGGGTTNWSYKSLDGKFYLYRGRRPRKLIDYHEQHIDEILPILMEDGQHILTSTKPYWFFVAEKSVAWLSDKLEMPLDENRNVPIHPAKQDRLFIRQQLDEADIAHFLTAFGSSRIEQAGADDSIDNSNATCETRVPAEAVCKPNDIICAQNEDVKSPCLISISLTKEKDVDDQEVSDERGCSPNQITHAENDIEFTEDAKMGATIVHGTEMENITVDSDEIMHDENDIEFSEDAKKSSKMMRVIEVEERMDAETTSSHADQVTWLWFNPELDIFYSWDISNGSYSVNDSAASMIAFEDQRLLQQQFHWYLIENGAVAFRSNATSLEQLHEQYYSQNQNQMQEHHDSKCENQYLEQCDFSATGFDNSLLNEQQISAEHSSNTKSEQQKNVSGEDPIVDSLLANLNLEDSTSSRINDSSEVSRWRLRLPHPKYYAQRHRLFSLYDYGIRLDSESWFSATPEVLAFELAFRLRDCGVVAVVDGFCGAGGNAIRFAEVGIRVLAVDIDPAKIEMAKHNAQIHGAEVMARMEFVVGDYLQLACDGTLEKWLASAGASAACQDQPQREEQQKNEGSSHASSPLTSFSDHGCLISCEKDTDTDTMLVNMRNSNESDAEKGADHHFAATCVFLSPPWGGIDYLKDKQWKSDIAYTPPLPSFAEVVRITFNHVSRNLVAFLPKNSHVADVGRLLLLDKSMNQMHPLLQKKSSKRVKIHFDPDNSADLPIFEFQQSYLFDKCKGVNVFYGPLFQRC